jgi:periplasmic protein TonB
LTTLALEHDRSDSLRWGLCFAIVAALHVLVAMGLIRFGDPFTVPELPPAMIMIDLAPEPVAPAPEIPLPEPAPPVELQPEPIVIPEPDIPEPPPPVFEPDPLPEPIPEPPPQVEPEVVIQKPVERKPPPKPQHRPQPPKPVVDPPPAPPAPPVAQTPAPAPAAPPMPPRVSTQLPSFFASLTAQVQRNLRYPAAARSRSQQGTPFVHFRMNRQGQVITAQIQRSSGSTSIDQEAVAAVQRAQPLPAPPEEVTDAQLEVGFTIPLNFNIR